MTAKWLIQESLNFLSSHFNEQAFRCFAVTLLYSVTVNQLLMTPEAHYISKKTSYKDWR